MSDAQTAWEQWDAVVENRYLSAEAAFLAGYTAGQVQALTDAADAATVNFVFGSAQLKFADWLRARTEQLDATDQLQDPKDRKHGEEHGRHHKVVSSHRDEDTQK